MIDSFGNIINSQISLVFAIIGTIFLTIAVIGKSRLAIIEIHPGGFGRVLGLLLGLGFYLLAFCSFLFPPEVWVALSDPLRNQLQENIRALVPDPSQLMTYLTKLKLGFIHL
jgi:hypothetical protein